MRQRLQTKMENVVSKWQRDGVLRSKFGMTFDRLSEPIISLFVSFSFKLHLSTYAIMLPLSVQTGLSKCVALCHGCHGPSLKEWAVKQRVLNQPLLTPISGQQDEAPVAAGLVVSFIYRTLAPSHSPHFSLHSDNFIDGLSTLTMQVYCFVSPARLCSPRSPCFLLHRVSPHPCCTPRMLSHQEKSEFALTWGLKVLQTWQHCKKRALLDT